MGETLSKHDLIQELQIKINLPKTITNDLEKLCELFDIKKNEFIKEAIYEKILSYHETPEFVSDALLSSGKVVSLMEDIRIHLNDYYLKSPCLTKNYFRKDEGDGNEE